MGLLSNKISRDEVKLGDHIYSWRQAYVYSHHGIYVGDGQVNHFTREDGQETGTGTFLDKVIVSSSPNHGDIPCPKCGDKSKLGGVISSCLECFLAGGDLYVFEYGVSIAVFLSKLRGGTCTIAPSDPPEEVMFRANFLLQNGFGVYNVFKNNCEDFAIYCKTGLLITNTDVGRSGQAASIDAAGELVARLLSDIVKGRSGQAALIDAVTELVARFLSDKLVGRSGQVASIRAAARVIFSSRSLLPAPLRFVASHFSELVARSAMYCISCLLSDIGMRSDVSKVPVERLIADVADTSRALDPYSQSALNITNCVTVKLTQKNYLLWKTQFESFLSGQDLLGFVTGTSHQPAATIQVPSADGKQVEEVPNPDFQLWEHFDQVVKECLLGSVSEDILSMVVDAKTSQDVWVSLANHFNCVTSSELFELQRKLQTVTKLEKPMDEYLKEIKDICAQLSSIGSPVPEKKKIFAALHGLGREYEPIKTSIEGQMDLSPCPNFDDIAPRLACFHDRLQSYNTESSVTPHLAFAASRTSDNTQYYNDSSRGRGSGYGRTGSRGRQNFFTRGKGFHQQNSSSGNSQNTYNNENRPVCRICGKVGHPALKCWHRFDNNYQYEEPAQALAALHFTDVTKQGGRERFPDTGATAHITSSTQNLQQSQPYKGNLPIKGGRLEEGRKVGRRGEAWGTKREVGRRGEAWGTKREKNISNREHLSFAAARTSDNTQYYNDSSRGRGSGYGRTGSRGRQNFSTRGRGFHQQISSSSNSQNTYNNENRPVCRICGKGGHPTLKCWHRFDNDYQYEEPVQGLTALHSTDITEQGGREKYDTGATAHITSSTQNLQQSQPYKGNLPIKGGRLEEGREVGRRGEAWENKREVGRRGEAWGTKREVGRRGEAWGTKRGWTQRRDLGNYERK